jgi:hypothetical protein
MMALLPPLPPPGLYFCSTNSVCFVAFLEINQVLKLLMGQKYGTWKDNSDFFLGFMIRARPADNVGLILSPGR